MPNERVVVEKVTIESLNQALNTIGWKIDGVDKSNQWIHDHNGVRMPYRVLTSQIEVMLGPSIKNSCITFNFDGCQMILWKDTVCIGTKEVFIQCYNMSKSE